MNDLKVFILEDDPVSVKFVANLLQNVITKDPLDIKQVDSAGTLKEGFAKLDDSFFDVILLDLDLPDSKGILTVQAIHRRFPAIPIVVITGAYEDGLGLKAVAHGAEEYLLKGKYDVVMLNKAITYALQRKKIENALRFSEEKYKMLIENLKDVVVRLSIDGTIEYCSPVITDFAGFTPEEMCGTKIDDYFAEVEEIKKLHEIIYRIIFDKSVMTEEFVFRPKHRKPFWVEMTGKPVTTEHDMITVQCVMRDITERKRAEAEVRCAYEELKETQAQLIQSEKLSALGRFSSGIAHEVKNPLAIILGGIEYLATELVAASPEVIDAIEKIKASTLRADKIICDLLQYARPSELVRSKTVVLATLNETISLLKYRKSFKHIDIRKIIPNPELAIDADPNQIQQVLLNILMNAVEALPDGGVITIGVIERIISELDPVRPSCVIEVHDNGMGIDEDDLQRLFEPFFTTKRNIQGSGLGLSMSKMIINNHGGIMSVKSRKGSGTTVLIALPIIDDDIPVFS
jgi:PAS domain S-box-containing protein